MATDSKPPISRRTVVGGAGMAAVGAAASLAPSIAKGNDEMTREQKGKPKTGKGSMGQIVAAPLISELRQHRATLTAMLRSLKLPEVDAGALAAEAERKAGESERKRAAAQARWTRQAPA